MSEEHVRTQIRKAVTEKLKSAGVANGNVEATRILNVDDGNYPIVLVYTEKESSFRESMGFGEGSTLNRSLELSIEARHEGKDIDDKVDKLTRNIEKAIAEAGEFERLIRDIELTGTDIEFMVEGNTPKGIATLTYQVEYHTKNLTPEISD